MQKNVIASNRKSILFFLVLGYTLASMDRFFINYAVLPISEDLKLDASAMGVILSAFFAGYALMQIPGGWLADRFGARIVLVSSITVWSIFTGLTGVAWSLVILIAIRFVFGMGEGGFIPASAKMIALSFPKKSRSQAMSVLLSAAALAGLVTPIIAASLIGTIGWRTMFIYIGISGVVMAILFWHFLKPKFASSPYLEPHLPLKEDVNPAIPKGMVKLLFRTPVMWSLMIASFSMFFINWGTASWLPTYLVKERGLDLLSLGMLQMIPAATSIIFMLMSGYLIDKMHAGSEKWYGAVCGAGLAVFVYLMFNASNVTMFIIYQSILPFFMTTITILVNALPLKWLPESVGGSAVGMVNFGGQLSGFIAPLSIGFIVDASGGSFSLVVWLLVICGLLCCLSFLTLHFNKDVIFLAETGEVLAKQ